MGGGTGRAYRRIRTARKYSMTWRTCASPSASSARSAYSTRAVGFMVALPETRPRYCGASASSRISRRPRASLVAVPSDGGPVTADEPRDRGVVDAGRLRQLALRHLLGLELGAQPLVEGSTVLGGHVLWALPGRAEPSASGVTIDAVARRHHPGTGRGPTKGRWCDRSDGVRGRHSCGPLRRGRSARGAGSAPLRRGRSSADSVVFDPPRPRRARSRRGPLRAR